MHSGQALWKLISRPKWTCETPYPTHYQTLIALILPSRCILAKIFLSSQARPYSNNWHFAQWNKSACSNLRFSHVALCSTSSHQWETPKLCRLRRESCSICRWWAECAFAPLVSIFLLASYLCRNSQLLGFKRIYRPKEKCRSHTFFHQVRSNNLSQFSTFFTNMRLFCREGVESCLSALIMQLSE